MGLIIGKGFRDYIIKQISTRQEKLGLNDRDNDLLKYINNKTSWLRLSSGVDVDSSKTFELGTQGQEGNILAKNNVLFSARQYTNTNLANGSWEGEFTSGVGYSNLSSYGYNSTSDYGLVPPPGLVLADIKSLNRGSLKEANIKIVCHNLQQFKIIETLYLRLGYSILLEWGHTMWYDNTGALRTDMPDWVHHGFLKGDYSQERILDILTEQREEFDGNYDGFFGVVINFDWSIRVDGGYDISIRARSVGDIIESLKLNVNYPIGNQSNNIITFRDYQGNEISAAEAKKRNPDIPDIELNTNRTTLDTLLYYVREILIQEQESNSGEGYSYDPFLLNTNIISFISEIKANYINKEEAKLSTSISGYKAYFTGLSQDENGESKSEVLYYITLGTLLRIIENFLSLSDTSRGSSPIFFIDYNAKDNLCFTIPKQLSVDPNVCLIPIGDVKTEVTTTPIPPKPYVKITRVTQEVQIGFGFDVGEALLNSITQDSQITTEQIETLPNDVTLRTPIITTTSGFSGIIPIQITTTVVYYDINDTTDIIRSEDLSAWEAFLDSIVKDTETVFNVTAEEKIAGETNYNNLNNIKTNVFRTENPYVGKTMGILINLDYISSVLGNFIDEDGKLSLYDFLKNLMSGLQTALGSINSFEVVYNSENNTFNIIDNTFIPGVFDYLQLPKPEIAKFNPNLLKPNYGSFVTDVSITSKLDNKFTSMITIGAQVNGNVVGENATAFSKWNTGLTDRIIKVKQNINDPSIDITGSSSPEEAYSKNLELLFNYRNQLNNGNISIENINNSKQNIVDIFKYEVGYFTEKEVISGVGFIPLSLNLTFDGLSGIRIYDVYNIDDTLLPKNYKNRIQFTATGVSHKIDNNGWLTSLESISGPKQDNLVRTITSNQINNTNKSLTNVKKAEELLNNGGCGSLSSSKLSVAEKILQEANKFGIKDKNRLTCLLTVAYAEAKFTLRKTENFNYRVDRIGTGTPTNWNGDASIIFKDSLTKAGVDVPNDLEKILTNPSDSLANYVYANRGKNGGPSSKEGSKYIGRGITQTTFKSGYQVTQDTLKKYNINVDLISNPDNIFQYEIPVLVIGKLEGLYGKKLSSGVDYINNATNIAQTQNGGGKAASDNYIAALKCINDNSKIQELISKYS